MGFWESLLNAIIGASVADAPAVTAASGWKQDSKGKWVQEPSKASSELASNLGVISSLPWMFSGTGNAVLQTATKPINTLWRWLPAEVRGALNLTAGVEGINNLTGEDGVKKTVKLFKEGDFSGGVKSAIGDAMNGLMIVPIASTATRSANWLADKVGGKVAQAAINRFSPIIKTNYNWRTNTFTPYLDLRQATAGKVAANLNLTKGLLETPTSGKVQYGSVVNLPKGKLILITPTAPELNTGLNTSIRFSTPERLDALEKEKRKDNDFISIRYKQGRTSDPTEYEAASGPEYMTLFDRSVKRSDVNWWGAELDRLFGKSRGTIIPEKYHSDKYNLDIPMLTIELPDEQLAQQVEYFNNVVKPLFEQKKSPGMLGGLMKLPLNKPKIFKLLDTYERNIPGGYITQILGKSRYGGWWQNWDNKSYINMDTPMDLDNVKIHEWVSHGTDEQLPALVQIDYEELIKFLQDSDNYRFGHNPMFRINDSISWKEIRATLNELRFALRQYWKHADGSIHLLDIDKVSDSKILEIMENLNAYGYDYVQNYSNLTPEAQERWMRRIRKALKTLPVLTLPFLINANNKTH